MTMKDNKEMLFVFMILLKLFDISSSYNTTTIADCDTSSSIRLDLIFLLDSSGSLDEDEWLQELEFVTAVTEELPSNTRVGLIIFSGCKSSISYDECFSGNHRDLKKAGFEVVFTLTTYGDDLDSTRASISKLNVTNYIGSYTWTLEAFELAYDDFINSTSISEERTKMMFVITDGKPTDYHAPCRVPADYGDSSSSSSSDDSNDNGDDTSSDDNANCYSDVLTDLQDMGVDIYVIGIGASFTTSNIETYVECMVDDDSDKIYLLEDFDQLINDTFINEISSIICDESINLVISEVMIEDDFITYIELFNPSINTNINGFKFDGLFQGTIENDQIIMQGDYWVISDRYPSITALEYMSTNSTDYVLKDYSNNWVINESMSRSDYWWVKIYDAADNLIDSVHFRDKTANGSSTSWPYIHSTYTFKLTNVYSDNSEGVNWDESCLPFGTPKYANLDKCPTVSPTNMPSNIPSYNPTKQPSKIPSMTPSYTPTKIPTNKPTNIPSIEPTQVPTQEGGLQIDSNDTRQETTKSGGNGYVTTDVKNQLKTSNVVVGDSDTSICYLWPTEIEVDPFYLIEETKKTWNCWLWYYIILLFVFILILLILIILRQMLCAKKIAERKRIELEAIKEKRLAYEEDLRKKEFDTRLKSMEFIMSRTLTDGRYGLPNLGVFKRTLTTGDKPRNTEEIRGLIDRTDEMPQHGGDHDGNSSVLTASMGYDNDEEYERELFVKSMMNIFYNANNMGYGSRSYNPHGGSSHHHHNNHNRNNSGNIGGSGNNFTYKGRNGGARPQSAYATLGAGIGVSNRQVPIREEFERDENGDLIIPLSHANNRDESVDRLSVPASGALSSQPHLGQNDSIGNQTKNIMNDIMNESGFNVIQLTSANGETVNEFDNNNDMLISGDGAGNSSNNSNNSKNSKNIKKKYGKKLAKSSGNESQSLMDELGDTPPDMNDMIELDNNNNNNNNNGNNDIIHEKQKSDTYGDRGGAGDKIDWEKLHAHRQLSSSSKKK